MTLRVMITAVLVITVASLARATTNDDDANATCSDGTPGYQTRSACCVIECGYCGHAGCGIRNGLGAEYCCADQIERHGEHCLVKGEAPCHLVTPSPIVSPYTPSPTSPPTGTPSPTSPPTGTPSPTSPPTGTPSPTSPPTGTPSPTSPPTGTPSPTSSPTGTPSPTSSPIVDWCDKLKSAIEANKRVTYKLNINLICDETIIITKGKHATLTSSAGAPNGKYSISPSSQFIGRRSSASRIASLADIGGDESLFVVENGGSLSVKNVIFDLSPSDKEGGGKTASSPFTETPVNGSPSTSTTDTAINGSPSTSTTTVAINGPPSTSHTATATNGSSMLSLSEVGHKRVRAIYTAGKVNIENCSFVGSPYVATESVMNGGAIFMVDVDDTSSGPSSVICTGSTFDSYSVGGSGGAIFAEGRGLLQVTGSSFSKNSAGGSGAGENADKTNDSGADTVGNGKGGNDPKTVSNIFINSTGIRKGGNGSYITTDSTTDEASTDDGGRGTDTAINTFIATTGEVKGGNGTGNTTEHFTNTTGSGGIDLNITTDIFTDTTGIGEDGTGTKTTPDIVNVIMSAGGGGGGGGSASYSDNTTDKATYTVDTGGGREETSGGAGLRDPDTDITTSRTSNIVGSRASASTVAGAGGGGSGGAIYAGPDVALNVRDSTFEENTATDGGAIASYGGALTNIIISNTVTTEIGFGAVVSNDPDGKTSPRGLSISDSTFKGNTGGATATFNTNVDIKNSIFIYNDGAVYFGTLDLERGFKLRVDGGKFEGNGPTPPSWGAGIFTGSGDLIGNNSGNGQAISCVKLLGVNCTDESECSMAVDEAAFAVTRDDTDCKICNENGQIIEIYNEYGQAVEMPSSSSDEIVGVSFASNDIDSASFIVAMCIVGIVACACCVSCIVSTVKEFQQEETATTTNFTTFGSAWEAPHLGSDTQYISERSYGVGNVADQETRLDI